MKIKILLLIITSFLLSGCSLASENKSKIKRESSLTKQQIFEKDEYCRSQYTELINKDTKRRWETDEPGNHVNIKEIFFSPKINECVYTYEYNSYYKTDFTKELIIARASTGDFIFNTIQNSTYKKNMNEEYTQSDFYENIRNFNKEVDILKNSE